MLTASAGCLRGFALLIREEIGVRTLEIVDMAVIEMPDAGGNFVEKVVVVGDEENGAFIALERDVERVNGFEIEVVGRLVKNKDVRFEKHQPAKENARGFSARERFDGLGGVIAAEKHLAEKTAKRLLASERVELRKPFDNGRVGSFVQIMFLREVAYAGFVAPADGATIHAEMAIGIVNEAGRITNERAKQCGLPYTVAAEETDFFIAIYVG